jgi:hypothetical protein
LDVLGGKYGSKSAVLVLCKATGQAPLTLFGQSQKGNSPKFACRIVHKSPSESGEDSLQAHSYRVSEVYML